jgi:predicted Rossmann fold flavoprotein
MQFLKKSLYRFGPLQTKEWFEQRGVTLKTEPDGRMFPSTDDSQTIIDCIWQEMMRNKVQVYYHKGSTGIEKTAIGGWLLHFGPGLTYQADAVIIATGGSPKPDQYNWIKAIGHSIQPPVPSLFTFNIPQNPLTELMGVSVSEVTLKIAGTKFVQQGALLVTHWGLSGPAVLKTSAMAARELAERNYDFQVSVNWLNELNEEELKGMFTRLRKEQGGQQVHNKNPFKLPARLWEFLLHQCGIKKETRWGDLPAASQNKLIVHLLRDTYQVKGKTTFKEEFVTCGGVSLAEIDPQTMQSRVAPGIYFAGEILDADGVTGGYNFQHAWTSGWIAAHHIIQYQ